MLRRKMQPIYLRLFTHLNIQTEGRRVGLNICRCVSRCECRRKHFQALSSVHTKASASQFSWLPLHSLCLCLSLDYLRSILYTLPGTAVTGSFPPHLSFHKTCPGEDQRQTEEAPATERNSRLLL